MKKIQKTRFFFRSLVSPGFSLKILVLATLLLFTPNLPAQEKVSTIGVEELETILNSESDILHVVNFWATWCGPCVTELPYFEKIASEMDTDEVKFLLISLDFPSQVESRLIPFLEEKDISLDVVLMTELDYDLWISKVDNEWKGNLPATLVFNNASDKREFVAGAVEENELRELITKNL